MVMVPNNFSINIAQMTSPSGWDGKPTYRHFAAVELGQMLEEEARFRYAEFVARFPEDDGFKLELTRVECFGRRIA